MSRKPSYSHNPYFDWQGPRIQIISRPTTLNWKPIRPVSSALCSMVLSQLQDIFQVRITTPLRVNHHRNKIFPKACASHQLGYIAASKSSKLAWIGLQNGRLPRDERHVVRRGCICLIIFWLFTAVLLGRLTDAEQKPYSLKFHFKKCKI